MDATMYVRIVAVDRAKRSCDVRDRHGGHLRVSFRSLSPVFRMPAEGETWSIYRQWGTWQLSAFQEDVALGREIDGLERGDTLLHSDGRIVLMARSGATLNGGAWGYHVEDYVLSDGGGSYLLVAAPVAPPVIHYGVDRLRPGDDYSLDGAALSITDDFASGIRITANYEAVARIDSDAASVTLLTSLRTAEETS